MEEFMKDELMTFHSIGQKSPWSCCHHNQHKVKYCWVDVSKSFTYVTKTRANLTTYSRKPGNYNGTISFEIDIMKNSSPINLNLGHT